MQLDKIMTSFWKVIWSKETPKMTWYTKVTYERNHFHSISHQILLAVGLPSLELYDASNRSITAIPIISVSAIRISPPRLLSLFGASTLHPEASFRRLRHPSQLWQTPGSAISRQQHPLGTFGVWTSRLCYCISFKRGLLTDILPSKLQRATGWWNWCFLQHGSSCRMSCHIPLDLKYNIHIDNIVYIHNLKEFGPWKLQWQVKFMSKSKWRTLFNMWNTNHLGHTLGNNLWLLSNRDTVDSYRIQRLGRLGSCKGKVKLIQSLLSISGHSCYHLRLRYWYSIFF